MKRKGQEEATADENSEVAVEATRIRSNSVTLNIKALSGDQLASIEALESWTVRELHAKLSSHVKPGTEISSLIYCEQVLDLEKTVLACGLANDTVLKAIIAGVPTLHLFQACLSSELAGTSWEASGRHGFWTCGGDFNDSSIVLPDVQHRSMDDAPQAAKEVAVALKEAFPGLDKSVVCKNSDADFGGEVVVISNPGEDLKAACVRALAIRDSTSNEEGESFDGIHGHATCDTKDWTSHLQSGFNWDPEEFDANETDEDTEKFAAMTKIMAERLTQGFMFTLSDELSVAPMIFGGVGSDGSIVGVLTVRAW